GSFVRQNSGLNRAGGFVQYARLMDDGARNRARLWLRSERSFGLSAVTWTSPESSSDEVEPPPAAATSSRPTGLFGQSSEPTRTEPTRTAPSAGLVPAPSVEPFTAPALSSEEKRQRLIALDSNEVRKCTRCRLCETRKNTVFGEGDPDTKI